MSIRRFIVASIAPLYAIVVALLIQILSGSPYEYMIGEVDDGKRMTICDIPHASDDMRDVMMPLTGVLVSGLLLTGIARSVRARRVTPSLILGVLLAAFWAYRFFLRTLGC